MITAEALLVSILVAAVAIIVSAIFYGGVTGAVEGLYLKIAEILERLDKIEQKLKNLEEAIKKLEEEKR